MTDQNEDIVEDRLAYFNERTFIDNTIIGEEGVTHGFTESGVAHALLPVQNQDGADNMEPSSSLYGKYPTLDDARAAHTASCAVAPCDTTAIKMTHPPPEMIVQCLLVATMKHLEEESEPSLHN